MKEARLIVGAIIISLSILFHLGAIIYACESKNSYLLIPYGAAVLTGLGILLVSD